MKGFLVILRGGTTSPSSAIVGNLIFYWLFFFASAASDRGLIRLGETVPRQEESSPAPFISATAAAAKVNMCNNLDFEFSKVKRFFKTNNNKPTTIYHIIPDHIHLTKIQRYLSSFRVLCVESNLLHFRDLEVDWKDAAGKGGERMSEEKNCLNCPFIEEAAAANF